MSWITRILGSDGTTQLGVESKWNALRATLRPIDYGTLGIYQISMQTGTMAAGLAANAEIFQFRWTDATRLALVTQVRFDGLGSIAAFAAGFAGFQVNIARSWTVDGSGGTAATITGNNQKLRTSMGTTLLGAARIASTAALTAGTKTLDSQGCGGFVGGLTAVAGAGLQQANLLDNETTNEHPIVLAQNEGLVVRATVPATGTWTGGVTIKWIEVAAY